MTPSHKDWCASYSKFIHYRMKAMWITLEDLAGSSSLPFEYVRKLLAAEICPTHKARKMMEKALGCSLEFVRPR